MSNARYLSGTRFERDVKAEYETSGYIVMRSSGSHGVYDLACFHPTGQTILIQCKVVSKESEAKRLIERWETPLKPAAYNQILAIKIKGNKNYIKHYLK